MTVHESRSEQFEQGSIELRNDAEETMIPKAEAMIAQLEKNGLPEYAETYRSVVSLCEAAKERGGLALLVGGSVRDMIGKKTPKDFDLEVYKLTPEAVEEIAQMFGNVSDVGKAFGILKISTGNGIDIDLSLPRTDSKTGDGHRGFTTYSDPSMSVADAARRRDFTINSMAADPISGELFDPFNGADDLHNRILRVTDPERFRDDPLRVMRALQFIGRFGLSLDGESQKIISSMCPELKTLPKERLYEEWRKLLVKSEKPSLGLSAGMALGVFKEIHPEFPPLAETLQEPAWHPEGDVWIHTLMCVDEAAAIAGREQLDEEERLIVLFGALCHDLGKPAVTTENEGRIISHGHEPAGEEPTKKFLATLGAPGLIRDKIARLVADHLTPSMLYIEEVIKGRPVADGVIRRLAKRIAPATIYELTLVAEADHCGRGPFQDPEIPDQLLLNLREYPAKKWLLDRARRLDVEKSKPADLLRGRDILLFGITPGEHVGKMIALANRLRDEKNFTKESVLQIVSNHAGDHQAILQEMESTVA